MMKILHTADLHIQKQHDARWQTLEKIIQIGKSTPIDILAISGDLFDSKVIASQLASEVRQLFSDIPFRVLIITGNHDADAYPEKAFLGENVTILDDLLTPVNIEGVFFWGFPYSELPDEEILAHLHSAGKTAARDAIHVLLYHGELLDISNGWGQTRGETYYRYLPVKLSYFHSLPWQYILAGHFHSSFYVSEFKPRAYFVYPGSPIPISRRETGIRKINLFEIGSTPAPQPLTTPYYEKTTLRLNPFQPTAPLATLQKALAELPPYATLLLEVTGYFNSKQWQMTETELHNTLTQLNESRLEIIKSDFKDIQKIMENDLFIRFWKRLKKQTLPEAEKKKILEMTLKAMMELNL